MAENNSIKISQQIFENVFNQYFECKNRTGKVLTSIPGNIVDLVNLLQLYMVDTLYTTDIYTRTPCNIVVMPNKQNATDIAIIIKHIYKQESTPSNTTTSNKHLIDFYNELNTKYRLGRTSISDKIDVTDILPVYEVKKEELNKIQILREELHTIFDRVFSAFINTMDIHTSTLYFVRDTNLDKNIANQLKDLMLKIYKYSVYYDNINAQKDDGLNLANFIKDNLYNIAKEDKEKNDFILLYDALNKYYTLELDNITDATVPVADDDVDVNDANEITDGANVPVADDVDDNNPLQIDAKINGGRKRRSVGTYRMSKVRLQKTRRRRSIRQTRNLRSNLRHRRSIRQTRRLRRNLRHRRSIRQTRRSGRRGRRN